MVICNLNVLEGKYVLLILASERAIFGLNRVNIAKNALICCIKNLSYAIIST